MKYLSFLGNSTRSEYWGVMIINAVALIFMTVVSLSLMEAGDEITALFSLMSLFIGIVAYIYISLAVVARRCRDAGISPWWTLIMVVPYVSFIALVVFGCIPTSVEEYRYETEA